MMMANGTVSPDVVAVMVPILEPYKFSIKELEVEYARVALELIVGLGQEVWEGGPPTAGAGMASAARGVLAVSTRTASAAMGPRGSGSAAIVMPSKPAK